MSNSRQDLEIEVKNGRLVISIGIETLGFSAVVKSGDEYCDDDGDYMPYYLIRDSRIFAKDVARALKDENSEGPTGIQTILDEAITQAMEDGSLGIVTHDDSKRVKEACRNFDSQKFKSCFYKGDL